jgi:hypothetical protein
MPVRVKSAGRRIHSYNLKTDPKHIAEINEKQRLLVEVHHAEAQIALSELETMAKQELATTGVFGHEYVSYLNFVRECWKKKCKYAGESLKVEVAVVLLKWKTRKLDENILARLRKNVLTIDAPSTPIG